MVDFLRTFRPDVKEKYIEITSFDTSTKIFIDRIIEQCKELETEKITIESIYNLRLKLEKICEDVKRINELYNEIGIRFQSHYYLMENLDSINEIINHYQ